MKKTLVLFVFLILPLFSVSSESYITTEKFVSAESINEPSFSNRKEQLPGRIPADLIESVLEESEEKEEEKEESLDEHLQHPSCLTRILSRICSEILLYASDESASTSCICLTLPLLRAPPSYS